MLGKFGFVFIMLSLAACSHSAKQKLMAKPLFESCGVSGKNFTEGYQQLESSKSRTFRGKVSVVTERVKEQASMVWQTTQANEHQISIYGPLGAGATKLVFNQDSAQLTDNKGRQYKRRSAEQLLSEVIDWPIPVEALAYWLMAVPEPTSDCEYKLNVENQLSVMQQLGWQVSYSKYKLFGEHLLPVKIEAKSTLGQQYVKVKLIVKSWQWD